MFWFQCSWFANILACAWQTSMNYYFSDWIVLLLVFSKHLTSVANEHKFFPSQPELLPSLGVPPCLRRCVLMLAAHMSCASLTQALLVSFTHILLGLSLARVISLPIVPYSSSTAPSQQMLPSLTQPRRDNVFTPLSLCVCLRLSIICHHLTVHNVPRFRLCLLCWSVSTLRSMTMLDPPCIIPND